MYDYKGTYIFIKKTKLKDTGWCNKSQHYCFMETHIHRIVHYMFVGIQVILHMLCGKIITNDTDYFCNVPTFTVIFHQIKTDIQYLSSTNKFFPYDKTFEI